MRRVSSAVFVCLAVFSAPGDARAQQVGPVALAVEGDCVSPEALREAASAELTERDVAVRVRVRCGAVVTVDVTVASARALHTRRIELSAAEAVRLPEAVGLIVGVAIGEWREAVAARSRPPPMRESLRLETPVEAPVEAPAETSGEADAGVEARDRFSLHLGAQLGERSPASGFAAELSLAWRPAAPIGVEIGLMAALPRDVSVREGTLGLFWYAARASGCVGGDAVRALWLGGCVGLELGVLETRASGFAVESHSRSDPWLAADLRARLELTLDAVSLRLDALLGVPLWTPTLVVATQDDPRAIALAFGPVFGGTVASVGVHFFP